MTLRAADIAHAMGGTRQASNRWIAPCPVLTHGKGKGDRNPSLSIRDGARPGEVLVHCFAGCEPKDIEAALRDRGLWSDRPFGHARAPVQSGDSHLALAEVDARRTARAMDIWRASSTASGTLVETYLASRGITLPVPPTLRFHPGLRHGPSGQVWPAMVALVTRGTDNTPLGIHRTFLSLDGSGKAPIEPNKMMLGPTRGAAVRLSAAGDTLMVGESIETCLSVLQETGGPTWSALSTSGLRTLSLPDAVREVIVLADGDGAGEAAAKHAAGRWQREGRRVRIARAPRGFDFNDLLLSAAAGKECVS